MPARSFIIVHQTEITYTHGATTKTKRKRIHDVGCVTISRSFTGGLCDHTILHRYDLTPSGSTQFASHGGRFHACWLRWLGTAGGEIEGGAHLLTRCCLWKYMSNMLPYILSHANWSWSKGFVIVFSLKAQKKTLDDETFTHFSLH